MSRGDEPTSNSAIDFPPPIRELMKARDIRGLNNVLHNKKSELMLHAAMALAELGAIEMLLQALTNNDHEVRMLAEVALRIKIHSVPNSNDLKHLVMLLEDPDPSVRGVAANVLDNVGWVHQTTQQYAALSAFRDEQRKIRREQNEKRVEESNNGCFLLASVSVAIVISLVVYILSGGANIFTLIVFIIAAFPPSSFLVTQINEHIIKNTMTQLDISLNSTALTQARNAIVSENWPEAIKDLNRYIESDPHEGLDKGQAFFLRCRAKYELVKQKPLIPPAIYKDILTDLLQAQRHNPLTYDEFTNGIEVLRRAIERDLKQG